MNLSLADITKLFKQMPYISNDEDGSQSIEYHIDEDLRIGFSIGNEDDQDMFWLVSKEHFGNLMLSGFIRENTFPSVVKFFKELMNNG